MITGICCRYGAIKNVWGKTEGDNARVPSSQAITGGARATGGPCVYMHVQIHRSVFLTVNHKVYTATYTRHSCIYSDIFVTHYPKPYTKMLPYVRLGVDMFY